MGIVEVGLVFVKVGRLCRPPFSTFHHPTRRRTSHLHCRLDRIETERLLGSTKRDQSRSTHGRKSAYR